MRAPVRLLRPLSLALLLGLSTTLAVALWISAYTGLHTFKGIFEPVWPKPAVPGWLADAWPPQSQIRFSAGCQRGHVSVGADCIINEPGGEDPPMVTFWSERFGWPFHSLQWVEAGAFQDSDKRSPDAAAAMRAFDERVGWRRAVGFPAWTNIGGPMDRRMVPTLPLWPGLLLDTLIYAFPFWCALYLPGAVRRARRRRRGQCVRCGYTLAGLNACPECGDRVGSAPA